MLTIQSLSSPHTPSMDYWPTVPHISATVGYAITFKTDKIRVSFKSVHKRKGSWDWLWRNQPWQRWGEGVLVRQAVGACSVFHHFIGEDCKIIHVNINFLFLLPLYASLLCFKTSERSVFTVTLPDLADQIFVSWNFPYLVCSADQASCFLHRNKIFWLVISSHAHTSRRTRDARCMQLKSIKQ